MKRVSSVKNGVYIDYFMVGERVRFLFTSRSPQRVNKNRTREPTMK